jgi:hypothetical protein
VLVINFSISSPRDSVHFNTVSVRGILYITSEHQDKRQETTNSMELSPSSDQLLCSPRILQRFMEPEVLLPCS